MTQTQLDHWAVIHITPEGKGNCIARYRFRNEAESHASFLNKLIGDKAFKVIIVPKDHV